MMALTPKQLSALDLMGIPVWALRTEQGDRIPARPEQVLPVEQIACSRLIAILSSLPQDEQTQRLWQAMCYAIGLKPEQVMLITTADWSAALAEKMAGKPLLILGESVAADIFHQPLGLGRQQINNPDMTVIVSYSLAQLLADNLLKATAWQHLKMIQETD